MGEKILMVEDDLLTARAYQKLLEGAGYKVDVALDGEEALVQSKDGVHCIILDISLPKVDGWEVLARIKGDRGTRHIPVVVSTVLDGDHYREKAKALGADSFVNKFNDDLLSEVEKILGGEWF